MTAVAARLADLRAALSCDETAVCDGHVGAAELSAYGLVPVDVVGDELTVAPAPSWLLPPVHHAFAFGRPAPLDPAAGPTVTLWRNGKLDDDAVAEVLTQRTRTSWWLRYVPGARDRAAARIRDAAPLLDVVAGLMAREYPGAVVRSVALNGSYLWAADPHEEIDLAVVLDGVPAETFDHHAHIELPSELRWVAGGATVEVLDVLVVGAGALARPDALTGMIGDWVLPNGRPYPYDMRRSTVGAAIRYTFATGVTIAGVDHFADLAQEPADLLALAYYFTQEATVLLAWNKFPAKAALRLYEANLVCRRAEELLGVTGVEVPGVAEVAALTRAAPEDPDLTARVQGWFGGPADAVLPATVARLARTRHLLGAPDPAPAAEPPVSGPLWTALRAEARAAAPVALVTAALDRAVAAEWPAWALVRDRVARHPLACDIATLSDLVRTGSPATIAAHPRPGRLPDRDFVVEDPDRVARAAVLWAGIGPRLLAARPLPADPDSAIVAAVDAIRVLTGASLAALGAPPASALGDLVTAAELGEL